MADFLHKRDGDVEEQDRGKIKDMELLPYCYQTFEPFERHLQEVQRLQKEQVEYGTYTFIAGIRQTYEEMIQSLVERDLRRQYEERRRRKSRV